MQQYIYRHQHHRKFIRSSRLGSIKHDLVSYTNILATQYFVCVDDDDDDDDDDNNYWLFYTVERERAREKQYANRAAKMYIKMGHKPQNHEHDKNEILFVQKYI